MSDDDDALRALQEALDSVPGLRRLTDVEVEELKEHAQKSVEMAELEHSLKDDPYGELPEFDVSDTERWQEYLDNNKDVYGSGVICFTARWANLMERYINAGEDLTAVADQASHDADTEGITGFMYGAAVQILSDVWRHGEELRQWHNKSYGAEESDGVVNPAIVNIGKKDQ